MVVVFLDLRYSTQHDRKPPDLDTTLTNEDTDISTTQRKHRLKIRHRRLGNIINICSPVSHQLCDEVAYQLSQAANNVITVFKRLLSPPEPNSSDQQLPAQQKSDMVKNLGASVFHTHQLLIATVLEKVQKHNGVLDPSQVTAVKRLNDMAVRVQGTNDQNAVVGFMKQFSDVLLNIMQERLSNT